MRQTKYITKFVDYMPENLMEGILYVAPHFGCAMHKCMCGCGEDVCTPIEFGDHCWDWTYDGENVSISPSIGNFSYKCKSHYFLKNGNVQWC